MTTLGLEMVPPLVVGQLHLLHTTATLLHLSTRMHSRALQVHPHLRGLFSLLRSSTATAACSAPTSWPRLQRMMDAGCTGKHKIADGSFAD